MWTDQSYIIATNGINTDGVDPMYVASLGLLGYFISIEIIEPPQPPIDTGGGYGFPRPVEPVAYYPPSKIIRFKININNTEVIKEYWVSDRFAMIFARFISSTQIVTNVVARLIESVKTTIKAIIYD